MTTRSGKTITVPRNPFHPTFGRSPAIVGGRDVELDSFELVPTESPGNPWRTALVSGTYGVDKTVLLNGFETATEQLGWIVLRAHIGSEVISKLTDVTIPHASSAIDNAPTGEGRHLIGLSIAGTGGFKTKVSISQPEPDRNLLSQLQDLPALLMPQKPGTLLTLDEVQSTDPAQLNKIAHAIQDLNRDDAEIAFVAAGLPDGIEDLLQLKGTTFLRRAEHVSLGRLDLETTKDIIRRAAELGERTMTEDAVELTSELSYDYPYLIQAIGSIAWAKTKLVHSDAITAQHVSGAAAEPIRRIGLQVHTPSLRKVPPRRIVFLKAMARLSPNGKPVATDAIAETMGRKLSGISQLRHGLIYHELIVSAPTGYVEFTLPYFADYLNTLVE